MTRLLLSTVLIAACADAGSTPAPDGPPPFEPAAPFPLADTDGAPTAIAADVRSVVWISGGDATGTREAVHRIDLSAPHDDQILYEGTGHTAAIAIVDGSVYWADADAGAIERLPRDADAPTAIVTGLSGITEVAVDRQRVYWVAPDGVHAADRLDGSGVVNLHEEALGAAGHLAIDATRVYWVSADGTWEMPKAGGPRGFLAPSSDAFVGVETGSDALDGGGAGAIAISDGTRRTITQIDSSLAPTSSIQTLGVPGPVASDFLFSIFAEEPDPSAGIADSKMWFWSVEGGAPRVIQELPGRISSFALSNGMVFYGAGTTTSGELEATPLFSPTY